MSRLTEAQRVVLQAMADGHEMVFSQDGDMAWLWPKHPTGFLAANDVIGLRDRGYIAAAPDDDDEYVRFGPPSIITSKGRAALSADMPAGGGEPVAPAHAPDWEKAARQLMAEKDAYITLLYTDEVFVGTHWDGPPLAADTPTWPVLCAHVSAYGAAAEEIAADDVIPLANLVKEFGRDAVQAWVCHKHNIDKPVKGDLSESGRKALAALRAAAPHLGVREG